MEEETSDIVREIYRLYDEGKNLKEIVAWLYGTSQPTYTGLASTALTVPLDHS